MLNIPTDQLGLLKEHLARAESYVFTESGQTEALIWMQSQLSTINPKYGEPLWQIVNQNLPSPDVSYVETGYDSCQSHRKLSKIIGETFLIGGLIYESKLMGLNTNIDSIKNQIGSEINIPFQYQNIICQMAQELGGNQDFLFPGVTPTDNDTPSLSELTALTLSGESIVSVRNLSGVGGVRNDKEWNWSTDLPTFINLKVTEDKRYYPGMGIFYWLSQTPIEEIPVLAKIKNSPIYNEIKLLQEAILQTPKNEKQNISILCSTTLLSWHEMKQWLPFDGKSIPNDLGGAFHSPSFEFNFLSCLFKDIISGKNVDKQMVNQLHNLKEKLSHLWSFNSTIHLPWTSEIAGLSNNMIGQITNMNGDYCIKYGIGQNGKSIVINEYHFGQQRLFPAQYNGKVCYSVEIYPESELFTGNVKETGFNPDKPEWLGLKKNGLIKTMLEIINTYDK